MRSPKSHALWLQLICWHGLLTESKNLVIHLTYTKIGPQFWDSHFGDSCDWESSVPSLPDFSTYLCEHSEAYNRIKNNNPELPLNLTYLNYS